MKLMGWTNKYKLIERNLINIQFNKLKRVLKHNYRNQLCLPKRMMDSHQKFNSQGKKTKYKNKL